MMDPLNLFYLIEHQVWARRDTDGVFTQGITALGVHLSGEIYMCRPKGVGMVLEQGKSMGVVELAKSIISVKTPLSGEVIDVNPRLKAEPDLVFRDPYGEGWLIRIRPSHFEVEQISLLTGAAVIDAMRSHASLYRVTAWPPEI